MTDPPRLPSVDRVARAVAHVGLPHPVLVRVTRQVITALRSTGKIVGEAEVVGMVRTRVEHLARGALKTVINATGVVIHTNLGRAPLGDEAVAAIVRAAGEYTTLEYDLETGERGRRGALVEELLATLCEADSATIVNNCAAALLLILRNLIGEKRKQVVISRGELVQIGGGFRVPEILEASGALLREVGTTNQTALTDYANAINEHTALVLHVHRSNFWMEGFVGSPSLADIAALCREKGVVLVDDLGSGLMRKSLPGAEMEPGPADVLRAGADLVCFSGDKLFGGPQAGIIAGKAHLVASMKKEPLFRALRCDKLMLAGVEATALSYLQTHVPTPVMEMLAVTVEALRTRAAAIVAAVGTDRVTVVESQAQVGGGSLPQVRVPSASLEVRGPDPQALAKRLRLASPPVLGYIANDKLRLDLRTVFPRQDAALAEALRKALA